MIDPLKDLTSKVELVQSCGDDKMIVRAARVSYGNDLRGDDKFNEKDRRLLKRLIKDRHGSPTEHNLITYRIVAPLYVVQEMLRHRIGVSFSQMSARYTEPGVKEHYICKFYTPPHMRGQDKENRQCSNGLLEPSVSSAMIDEYIACCENSFRVYEKLIAAGVARELARGVLPHSTYTSLYITFNMRSLLHFIGLRHAPDAQPEIQAYAAAFKEIAKEIFPYTFSVMEELENERRKKDKRIEALDGRRRSFSIRLRKSSS